MSDRTLNLWARRLAPTLSLLATCLGYLKSHHYPVITAEVLILLSGAVVLGAAIGYACERLSERSVAVVCGGLVIFTAIFAFNIFDLLSSIDKDALSNQSIRYILKFIVIFILPLWLALLVRRDVSLILSCAMVVFIIGIVVFPSHDESRAVLVYGSDKAAAKPPRRLVLHVILDEFAGNSGIGPSFPDGGRLRRDVSAFFVQHNFLLYEGAFSTYPVTRYSVPALFSFSRPMPNDIEKEPTAWFEKLHREGYTTAYIGIDNIPLCDNPAASKFINRCTIHPFQINLKSIYDSPASPWHKAGEILQVSLLNFKYLDRFLIRRGIITDTLHRSLSPAVDARTMLLNGGGDLAIVVHVLVPHAPMLYDQNCAQHSAQFLLDDTSRHGAARQAYERAYSGQVRCALKQLGSLLQIVDRRWPEATVIVNGDHGLRLRPFTADREDVRLRHAALFAIRAKGIAPGVISQEQNLQMLFARYAGGVQIPDSRLLYGDNDWDANAALAYPK